MAGWWKGCGARARGGVPRGKAAGRPRFCRLPPCRRPPLPKPAPASALPLQAGGVGGGHERQREVHASGAGGGQRAGGAVAAHPRHRGQLCLCQRQPHPVLRDQGQAGQVGPVVGEGLVGGRWLSAAGRRGWRVCGGWCRLRVVRAVATAGVPRQAFPCPPLSLPYQPYLRQFLASDPASSPARPPGPGPATRAPPAGRSRCGATSSAPPPPRTCACTTSRTNPSTSASAAAAPSGCCTSTRVRAWVPPARHWQSCGRLRQSALRSPPLHRAPRAHPTATTATPCHLPPATYHLPPTRLPPTTFPLPATHCTPPAPPATHPAPAGSAVTSDTRYLSADEPLGEWRVVLPRRSEVEYSVEDRGNHFFITIRCGSRPVLLPFFLPFVGERREA